MKWKNSATSALLNRHLVGFCSCSMSQGRTCVVVGAGIVGLSTAVCMQRAGFNVTIVADK